jgi:DNA invertase Pin-like site-specific DNA recombinase
MALVRRRDWNLLDTFVDHGVSGSKERRAALDQMNLYTRKHKVNAVVVWKADRLFRSLKNMVVCLAVVPIGGAPVDARAPFP